MLGSGLISKPDQIPGLAVAQPAADDKPTNDVTAAPEIDKEKVESPVQNKVKIK